MTLAVRWRVAALLFLAGLLNYLDRAAISVAGPSIKTDLALSTEQLGFVFSSFFIGYALFNFVGGWAADRFGAPKTLAIAIVAWSLFCGLTAVARGYASLVAVRILFGAAEGPFGATSAKATNQCFPKREVSSALALGASGTPVGALIAGPLVAWLIAAEGWRVSLFFVATVGILFAFVWRRFGTTWLRMANSTEGAALRVEPPESGHRLVGGGSRLVGTTRTIWWLARQPVIVVNAVAYFAYTYLLSLYLSWMPIFFMSRYHLDLRQAALGSSAPWIMGFVGIWAGALLSDRIFRSSGRLLLSRQIPQVAALTMAALGTGLLAVAPNTSSAIAAASLSLLALFTTGTSYWAVVQDVVPSETVGRASGLTHLIANLGGILGPAVTGVIVQRTDSFRLPWLTAAALCAVAVVAVATVAIIGSSSTTGHKATNSVSGE